MKLEKIWLPTYTKGEEIFNGISHGVGAIFGLIICATAFFKYNTISQLIGCLVFAFAAIALYSSSTVYHALKRGNAKKFMRLVDHCVIYVLITGSSVGMMLVFLYQYNKAVVISMATVSIILSIIGIIVTFIDQEKFKVLQMVLYMVVGWMSLILIYPIYIYCNHSFEIILFTALGGVVYTLGMIFYAQAKKRKYFHSIFHLFVLGGTIMHFIAIYIGFSA